MSEDEGWKVLALYNPAGSEPVCWLDRGGLPCDAEGHRLDPAAFAGGEFVADVPVPVMMLSASPTMIRPRLTRIFGTAKVV